MKGFTLIELLIVIAIVAILAAVVILVLNPAQLLAQSRDSQRISDLIIIEKAIALYLADVSSPNLAEGGYNKCYASTTSTISCTSIFTGSYTVNQSSSRAIDGSGWLPVNFTRISAGTPFATLPRDPINNSTTLYVYVASSTNMTFEINANMESTKYSSPNGTRDVETNDGGDNTQVYEVGSNLRL